MLDRIAELEKQVKRLKQAQDAHLYHVNPFPYHLELREDVQFQPILLEVDVMAPNEKAAVKMLNDWKKEYVRVHAPDNSIIGVCTHNWTEECLYQDESVN